MPSNGNLLKLGSIFILMATLYGCAFTNLNEGDQAQLVKKEVPKIIDELLTNQTNEIVVGNVVARNTKNLISEGWHGEEVSGNIDWKTFEEKYSQREYVFEVPRDRLHEEESGWDFATFSMFDRWVSWNTLFWECFIGTKQEFDKVAQGHYFRIFAPAFDRVYDIVIVRPIDPKNILIGDPFVGDSIDGLWKAIKPVKEDEFPGIFGPARFVVPVSASRLIVGHYSVLSVYNKRYFAFGTTPIFHSQFGRSRGRDCYILVFASRKEFVVIQTTLYKETSLTTFLDDLKNIAGINKQ